METINRPKHFNSDMLSAIGNTPLVELTNMSPNPNVKIYAKMESLNPGGSIKDRPAYYMITKAEESGELHKGKIILEATSGNTGIALAMIGAAKGYKVELCMPQCASLERRHIIEAFGAMITLTPAEKGTDGAIDKVRALAEKYPEKYYHPDQFSNPNNTLAHYETTGPEILSQTNDNLDYFITGIGTTGTLMGVGKYLKEEKGNVKIIGVEPNLKHRIQGLKNLKEANIPSIFNPNILDEIINIDDESAFATARELARKEGILAGISSGASVAVCIRIAQKIEKGSIVTIIADRGERYLSTNLFRSFCAKCPP